MFKPYRPWVAAAAAAATLLASLNAPPVSAETIVVGDQVTVRQTDVPHPKRGMSMEQVQKHFGEPRERHPTVGTPPITRWDYDKFAVFFEKNLVIDAVVPGSAAPIPAAEPAAAPSAVEAASAQPSDAVPDSAADAAAEAAAAVAAAVAPSPAPAAAPAAAPKGDSGSRSDAPLSNVSLPVKH